MTFAFEKGSDLQVLVNGAVLGGVTKLRRIANPRSDEIYTFLTDKPVARLTRERYVIKLEMHCVNGCVFDGEVESITIRDPHKTEIYTLCAVERCERRVLPHGEVRYIAVVTAYERSVFSE